MANRPVKEFKKLTKVYMCFFTLCRGPKFKILVVLTQDRHCTAAYCLRVTWGTLLIVDGLVLSLALGLGHGVVFRLALLLLLRGALLLQLSLVSHRALVFVNLHRRTLRTIEPFYDGQRNYTLSHFCSGIVVH